MLGQDAAAVEERLVALERQHALARVVSEEELPDGARTLCCCFVHALYHSALYASLTPSHRAALSAAVSALTRIRNQGGDAGPHSEPPGARRGVPEGCARARDDEAVCLQ